MDKIPKNLMKKELLKNQEIGKNSVVTLKDPDITKFYAETINSFKNPMINNNSINFMNKDNLPDSNNNGNNGNNPELITPAQSIQNTPFLPPANIDMQSSSSSHNSHQSNSNMIYMKNDSNMENINLNMNYQGGSGEVFENQFIHHSNSNSHNNSHGGNNSFLPPSIPNLFIPTPSTSPRNISNNPYSINHVNNHPHHHLNHSNNSIQLLPNYLIPTNPITSNSNENVMFDETFNSLNTPLQWFPNNNQEAIQFNSNQLFESYPGHQSNPHQYLPIDINYNYNSFINDYNNSKEYFKSMKRKLSLSSRSLDSQNVVLPEMYLDTLIGDLKEENLIGSINDIKFQILIDRNDLITLSKPVEFMGDLITRKRKQYESLTGIKFKCLHPKCEKTFTRLYNLKSHIKLHTGNDLHYCNYPNCSAKFTRRHDLTRHNRLHSKEKPFKCDYCGRKFSRADARARHIKVNACKLVNS